MEQSWQVLTDVLVLLAAALVMGTLAEPFRQSAIVGYLIAGTLVGPRMLGWVGSGENDNMQVIAEMGVSLLLFSIGLEFSFERLKKLGRVAMIGGTLQVVLTMAIAAGIALLIGRPVKAGIAIGAMIALSSTACVLRLLTDRAEIDSIYGRNALGILLLQDVAVIPLVLLVSLLSTGGTAGEAAFALMNTLLYGSLLIGGFFLMFRFVVPRLMNLQRWSRNRE